jgi:RimJ/RimL family protein N-acetyltransferase
VDEIRTRRCLLRRFRPEDRAAFAAIQGDPTVARFLPGTLSRGDSDALMDRLEAHIEEHGYGFWALEIPGSCSLAGFVGIARARFEAWFTPAVEVGWRLAPAQWGHGYATEAARAALAAGFGNFGLDEIVSYTVPANLPSRAVMQRLGMEQIGAFDHPLLPNGHALSHHVLYRITSAQFARQQTVSPP